MEREIFIQLMSKVNTISEWNELVKQQEADGDPIWGEKNFVIVNMDITSVDYIPDIPDEFKTIII